MTMPFNYETLARDRHEELLEEATASRLAGQAIRPSPRRLRALLARALVQIATWLAADALPPPAVSYQPSVIKRARA